MPGPDGAAGIEDHEGRDGPAAGLRALAEIVIPGNGAPLMLPRVA